MFIARKFVLRPPIVSGADGKQWLKRSLAGLKIVGDSTRSSGVEEPWQRRPFNSQLEFISVASDEPDEVAYSLCHLVYATRHPSRGIESATSVRKRRYSFRWQSPGSRSGADRSILVYHSAQGPSRTGDEALSAEQSRQAVARAFDVVGGALHLNQRPNIEISEEPTGEGRPDC